MTFYTLNMAVAQVEAKQWAREKNANFDFLWKFSNFQKNQNLHFLLPLTGMCYGHVESIKSHFLTLEKPKKQKPMQNNEYNILEVKND